MRSQKRRSKIGATLLEILLSLAIMAMIALGIGSLFNTGGQVWHRVDTNASLPDQAIVRQQLRHDLEHMPYVSHDVLLSDIFEGHANGFVFWTSAREAEPGKRRTQVEFVDNQLLVGEARARIEVDRYRIRYFGGKEVRDTPQWHDDWEQASILPRLIKIESWQIGGEANAPLTVQPAAMTRQREISLSSLVPPN